jgi:sugar O-acyltransferase (sialic acid O-acetyltransferase NeuD family)
MKKLIIFGLGEQAELAYFYFKNETNYQIEAFTVNQEFITKDTFVDGIPIVAFEDLEKKFTPEEHDGFVAIGYRKINALRSEKFYEFKQKGYQLASFISSKATNYATSVGENCFILEDNTIQPFVKIGNNVTLWSGNHIGHHSVIEDHCFITSQVVISGGCNVGELTFIGVNSTLRDHITIGKSNMIGAGAIILSSTKDNNVFMEKSTELSRVPSNRLRGI